MSESTPDLAESCEICGQSNPTTLETHHVVPQRYGGSDHPENLVKLCGSCHNAIENIYDDKFYERLGHNPPSLVDGDEGEPGDLGIELHSVESPDREFPQNPKHTSTSELSAYYLIEEHEPREEDIPDLENRVEKVSLPELKQSFLNHYLAFRLDISGSHAELLDAQQVVKLEEGQTKLIWTGEEFETLEEQSDESTVEDSVDGVVINPRDKIKQFDENTNHNQGLEGVWYIRDGEDGYISETVDLLHCGYCDRAFLPWQQADCAKHLQLSHGVENPYESVEGTSIANLSSHDSWAGEESYD